MSAARVIGKGIRHSLDSASASLQDVSHVIKKLFRKNDSDTSRRDDTDTALRDGLETPDYTTTLHNPSQTGEMSGPVVFYDPVDGADAGQVDQINSYVAGCNDALNDGYISPTGRVSTEGDLRLDASASARREARRAERAGTPYQGQAGHVPDTTWVGLPDPHSWLDLDAPINQSLGSQALRYPLGYKPTEFVYGGPRPS